MGLLPQSPAKCKDRGTADLIKSNGNPSSKNKPNTPSAVKPEDCLMLKKELNRAKENKIKELPRRMLLGFFLKCNLRERDEKVKLRVIPKDIDG